MCDECTTCTKCQRLFTKPLELDCFHSFCKGCISTKDKYIVCPTCTYKTEKMGSEPNADHFLQRFCDVIKCERSLIEFCETCAENEKEAESSFYCVDCKTSLCLCCRDHHLEHPDFYKHEVVPFSNILENGFRKSKQVYFACPYHGDGLNHCCMSCNSLCCMYCIIEDHKGHWSISTDDAIKYHTGNIRELFDSLKKFHCNIHEPRAALSKFLEMEKIKLVTQTKELYVDIIQHIKLEEARLLKEIDTVFETQRQIAQKHEREFEMFCLSAESVISKFKLINQYGNSAEMLRFYFKVKSSEVAERATDKLSTLPKSTLKNNINVTLALESLLKDMHVSVHTLHGDYVPNILKSFATSDEKKARNDTSGGMHQRTFCNMH